MNFKHDLILIKTTASVKISLWKKVHEPFCFEGRFHEIVKNLSHRFVYNNCMAENSQDIRDIIARVKLGSAQPSDIDKLDIFIKKTILLSTAVSDADGTDFWNKNLFNYIHAITEISSANDIDEIAQITITHLVQSLDADAGMMLQRKSANLIDLWSVYLQRNSKAAQKLPGIGWNDFDFIQTCMQSGEVNQFRTTELDDTQDRDHLLENSVQSGLSIPLKFKGQVHGCAVLLNLSGKNAYSPQQIAIGQLLIDQAAVSMENAILLARSRNRTQELEAVYQASISLTTSLELADVLNAILKSTMQLAKGADNSHIFLYESGKINFGAALWANGKIGRPFAQPRENGITYTVARNAEMITVENLESDTLYGNKAAGWHGAIIALPLKIGENVVGVMSVAFREPRKFSESETRVLRLMAEQAAIAIENARLHRLLKQQANTDFLTDLPNRRAFDARLETEIRRANRYLRPFTLVMLDLDRFKHINDTYGHPLGDELLKKAAQIMDHSVRDTDFLCRYGGDEFSIILPETDRITANEVIKRMQKDMENSIFTLPDGSSRVITFCAGIAVSKPRMTATALVKKADDALYRAKNKKLGYS